MMLWAAAREMEAMKWGEQRARGYNDGRGSADAVVRNESCDSAWCGRRVAKGAEVRKR